MPLLTEVISRHDVRSAWLALAAAHRRAGDLAAAATALAGALSRHVWRPSEINENASFMPLAAALARPGWCALTKDGVVLFGAARDAHLTLTLDGTQIRTGAERRSEAIALPPGWECARELSIGVDGGELLGSPLAIARLRRVEGCVEARPDGLAGWAWYPADPASAPELVIGRARALAGTSSVLADGEIARDDASIRRIRWAPFARPRSFTISVRELKNLELAHGAIAVRDQDGHHLLGSPLSPEVSCMKLRGVRRSCFGEKRARVPAALLGKGAVAAETDVIIPVHDGRGHALPCLSGVIRSLPAFARLVIIDDGSRDRELVRALRDFACEKRVTLLRNSAAHGFPAACNRAIRTARADADVVLLNSDTLVAPGWIEGLRAGLARRPNAATATPFSNNATILSYPDPTGVNPVPDQAETERLAALAAHLFRDETVEIPTGVGFCLYVKRSALAEVGPLRADVFAQGYGEENDFCLRARTLGWRHYAAPGVFVAHVGGVSFGAGGAALRARNETLLDRLHPEYRALLAAHEANDPLFPFRRRLDAARFTAERAGDSAVLLFTHARGGGVLQVVKESASRLRERGFRPIVLSPAARTRGERTCLVSEGAPKAFPNLRFAIPRELEALAALLAPEHPRYAECHHLVGHDHRVLELCARLSIPYDVIVHDYAMACARITLTDKEGRFCDGCPTGICSASAKEAKSELEEAISPARLRRRSRRELAGARRVVAPSLDTAERIRRYFPGVAVSVVPHEDDATLPPPEAHWFGAGRVVCVIGAIGHAKGYDILLAAAQDAARRNLRLRFVLVGYSCDDDPLLATDRVFITGAYQECEVGQLIAEAHADLALLPSIWPETWCFALSEAWRAGLSVAAFDLGAQAERIRATGRGWLLPPGLSPSALNDALLALTTLPPTVCSPRAGPRVVESRYTGDAGVLNPSDLVRLECPTGRC